MARRRSRQDLDPGFDYCVEHVRRNDHDRFLTAQFAPADRRNALLALYAFNIEISKVREVVTEPVLGQMRLQWWRDVMEAIFAGSPPSNEIARALSHTVRQFTLDREKMGRLINAREFDLLDEAPDDLAALEHYLDASAAELADLALTILGIGAEDKSTRAAARHVSLAFGLSGIVRATPFLAAQRRTMIPKASLAAAGIRPDDLFTGRPVPGLGDAARHLAERAVFHLEQAASDPKRGTDGRRVGAPVFLWGRLAGYDLARLRKSGFDPYDRRLAKTGTWRILALIGAGLSPRRFLG